MPFCTNCGRQNPDDARFCSQCGTRLVAPDGAAALPTDVTATIQFGGDKADKVETSDRQLSPVDAAAVDALPVGHALLVVQKGPGAGSRFLLDQASVTAGRHPQSAIFLDDVTVSRSHAVFSRTRSGFTVEDKGSLNGTYVNRDRIEKVDLNDGDEVQIGKYRLVYFAGHEDA
ncbi:MAG: zinc-ribbon and FHA domain-containing protein [Nocardioidaceae bacterium]|nr:zinc-ribbon and FHA domain-containing protein [Nocardioidaceae bacterium]